MTEACEWSWRLWDLEMQLEASSVHLETYQTVHAGEVARWTACIVQLMQEFKEKVEAH